MSLTKPVPQAVDLPPRAEKPISWADRRLSPRYSLTAAAEVVEIKTNTIILGRCTDLSAGGCYVDTLNPFPKGTEVRVRIEQESRSVLTEAIVVFGQTGMGLGLAFTTMAPGEKRKLADWLRELSCVSATPPPPKETDVGSPPDEAGKADRNVLNQLISLLIRKRLLTDQEGNDLLRELFR